MDHFSACLEMASRAAIWDHNFWHKIQKIGLCWHMHQMHYHDMQMQLLTKSAGSHMFIYGGHVKNDKIVFLSLSIRDTEILAKFFTCRSTILLWKMAAKSSPEDCAILQIYWKFKEWYWQCIFNNFD